MTIWEEHDVEEMVLAVLADVPAHDPAHHFGRPYLSAYQLAIELHRRDPRLADLVLEQPVGGARVGRHNSLAQYLAKRLSDHIRADADYPVEGAFISNRDVVELSYRRPDGTKMYSSLTGTGYDLSMFRLRPAGRDPAGQARASDRST